jgi:hypothetical protein
MGRPPGLWKDIPHPDFWKEVKRLHEHEPRVRLRPAANLIGIFIFPYGWLTTEFDPIVDEDTCEFEKFWRKNFRQRVSGRSPFGKKAARHARGYRRREVEAILKRNLKREMIRYECLHIYNPKAPAYGQKPPEYPINPIEFERMNVELSTVGRLVSRQHVIRIDVEDLLNCLIEECETRGKKATINRGHAEHLARKLIETWQPSSERAITKQAIIDAVADPVTGLPGTSDGDVASSDQVRSVINKLWPEYGLGE